MIRSLLAPFALVLTSALAVAQAPASSTAHPSEALDLLTRVAQRYADAKTYALSATEEMTQTGDYQRIWQKIVSAAAEAPGGRYYFEAHGSTGGVIRISDGKTTWKYHIEENHYTAQLATAANAQSSGPIPMAEVALFSAQNLRQSLANLTRTLHSASLYPQETITVDGKPLPCLVVRIRNADENRADPNTEIEKTIWIDKQQQTIARIEERRDTKHGNVPKGLPLNQAITTTYTRTVLDGAVPDSVFRFVPPAGAVLMADFPDPMDGYGLSTMTGDMIPALKFKSADGKIVPIESFRGKPVLIDFWATWCAPCVAAIPRMAEVYKEGKEKGLVLLSVDQDEDAAKATEFLAKHGYDWPNFHDGDGEIAKMMGSSPLPRLVLVDAKGQIAYDGMGGDENRLRTHLALLGPEFADLAPKPKPAPCNVAMQSK